MSDSCGPEQSLQTGAIVGQYVVVKPLKEAAGGMSAVYEAEVREQYRTDGKPKRVILKVASARNADFLRSEGMCLARLDHPGIARPVPLPGGGHPAYVGFYNGLPQGQVCYLATEYQAGGSLAERLAGKGRLSLREAVTVARRVAGILEHVHAQHLVYLDVKPGNVLYRRRRRGWHWSVPEVVLCDFGSACDTRVPQGSEIPVTIDYASPEQLRRARDWREPGPQSDVFSLGAMLYEMLTGRVPFEGNAGLIVDPCARPRLPSALRADIPPDLETIVLRALEKEPTARFAGAAEMAAALERVALPVEWDVVGRLALLAGALAVLAAALIVTLNALGIVSLGAG